MGQCTIRRGRYLQSGGRRLDFPETRQAYSAAHFGRMAWWSGCLLSCVACLGWVLLIIVACGMA